MGKKFKRFKIKAIQSAQSTYLYSNKKSQSIKSPYYFQTTLQNGMNKEI